MAVVNKFNVNNKQVTLDADIIENMSANDVSYDDSFQYDENTVGDKLSELEGKLNGYGGDKDITNLKDNVLSAYINNEGVIEVSTGYKTTKPYLLKKGHTVAINGNNVNFPWIGLTHSDSISIGSSVTVVPNVSPSTASYTATEDIYIVLCYAYLVSITDSVPYTAGIVDEISDLDDKISDLDENLISKVTELDKKLNGYGGDKDITNLNDDVLSAYINNEGIIERSGGYKTTKPYLLKKGHTVVIEGNNTNFPWIGLTQSDSINIGSSVTAIPNESTITASYTATEDIYIVLCYAYLESITDSVPYTAGIVDEISDLDNQVSDLDNQFKNSGLIINTKYVLSDFEEQTYYYIRNNILNYSDNVKNPDFASLAIPVNKGSVCHIKTLSVGEESYPYILTDMERNVYEKADSFNVLSGVTVTAKVDGFLYVNAYIPLCNAPEVEYTGSSIDTLRTEINNINNRIDIDKPFYGKNIVLMGDSHAENRRFWIQRLVDKIGGNYLEDVTKNILGKGANQVDTGNEDCVNAIISQAKNLVKAHNDGNVINVVILENGHPWPPEATYQNNQSKSWMDVPFKVKNVVEIGTFSQASENEKQWFNENFDSIIDSIERHLGTLLKSKWDETVNVLTFEGTPRSGTIKLQIDGGTEMSTTIEGTETIEQVVSKINISSFNEATNGIWSNYCIGNKIYMQYNNKSQQVPSPNVTFNPGNTGLTLSSNLNTNTSYVYRWYNERSFDNWDNPNNWVVVDANNYGYGYVKGAIEMILDTIPNIEIIIIGTPAIGVRPNTIEDELGIDIVKFKKQTDQSIFYENQRKMMQTCAELYSLKYIDLTKISGISAVNFAAYHNYSDVHPNKNGYERWADAIAKEL